MVQTDITEPRLRPGSHTLWDAWFSAGTERLASADRLRFAERDSTRTRAVDLEFRRICRDAREWFAHAIQQALGFPPDDQRLCISRAGHAWASYWHGHREEACLSAVEALNCLARSQNDGSSAVASHLTLAIARCELILGEVAFVDGNTNEALTHIDKSLIAFRQLGIPNADVAFLRERRGMIYLQRERTRDGIAEFQTAEDILRQLDLDVPKRTFLLSKIADNLILDGQYRQAVLKYAAWKRLSPLTEKDDPAVCGPERVKVAEEVVVFVRAFSTLGDLDAAQECLDIADRALGCIPDVSHDLLAALCTQRTEVLRLQGFLARAVESVACLKDLNFQLPLLQLRANVVHGDLCFDMGDYRQAEVYFAAAEPLLNLIPGSQYTERARVCLGQSRINTAQSKMLAAAEKAQSTFQFLEKSGRIAQPETAFALHDLSRSLLRGNRSDDSLPIAERAQLLLTSAVGPLHPAQIQVLNTLAEILVTFANPGDEDTERTGLYYCRMAEKLIEDRYPCRWFDLARCSSIRGQLLHISGRYREAETHFRCSLQRWNHGEEAIEAEHPEKAWTFLGLAIVVAGMEREDEAEQLFESVSELMLTMKLTPGLMGFEFNRLGNLYFRWRFWKEAKWLFLHAAAHYSAQYGKHHKYTQQVRENLERAAQNLIDSKQVIE